MPINSSTATRARLLSLLSEACELEHALACSYLYAAFSVKRDLAEGIDWRTQQRNRRWASQIYHVAAQEMLHLGQAWNMLTAVGGTPYYARANFPLAAKHFPLSVALVLRPLDAATMTRFTYYESPANNVPEMSNPPLPQDAIWPIDESFPYESVGQLYGAIRGIFEQKEEAELFIRDRRAQTSEATTDFPDIIRVEDRRSALRAIDMITEQGEGSVDAREDSHYGVFSQILQEIGEVRDMASIARPCAENPYVRARRDQIPVLIPTALPGIVTTEITDQGAIHALDLFDDVYVSMLQGMSFAYAGAAESDQSVSEIGHTSLELMTTVIKPLGEAICLLPSGQPGTTAGPSFALSRHSQLPTDHLVSTIVFGERLSELAHHADILRTSSQIREPVAADQIGGAASNLRRLASGFTRRRLHC